MFERGFDSFALRYCFPEDRLTLTVLTDEPIFSLEEEATLNVDALVNETDAEPLRHGTPIMPQLFDPPRRSTPSIPPGFSAAMAHRPMSNYSTPPKSRTASITNNLIAPSVPATPVRAPVASGVSTPAKVSTPQEKAEDATVATAGKAAKPPAADKPSTKASQPKVQLTPEESKKKAVETEPAQPKEVKPSVLETPVKATPKGKGKKGKAINYEPLIQKDTKENTPAPLTPAISVAKRQHPGKLDIAAATKLPDIASPLPTSSIKPDATGKARPVSLASAVSSVPASPAATSTGSPVKRTAPRTLRVVATPKVETPPASVATPQLPTVDKLRSRQASIVSVNQPGTPASELISETASIVTSASVSRASSPPPVGGKVGTAPIRKKTKSQAKKERQERARQILEEQVLALEEKTEEVQAPIIGRKKKTKKPGSSTPKPTAAAAAVAAAKSQPASPKATAVDDESSSDAKVSGATSAQSTTATVSSAAELQPAVQPNTEEAKEKNTSVQAIIADLQKHGELVASTLEFFKPLSSSLAHTARNPQTASNTATPPPDTKMHLTEADLEDLAQKKPVRISGQDGKPDSRTLITPQGKFFWGLTPELEEKALELEKHIEESHGAARFHPRKQTPGAQGSGAQMGPTSAQSQNPTHNTDVLPAIATALKEAGAKLSKGTTCATALPPVQGSLDATDPSMPWLNQNASMQASPQSQPQPQTPADAGAYLNQFVLPRTDSPSPAAPRTEMFAVGGLPGAAVGHMPVNVAKIAKAAKAVAERGGPASLNPGPAHTASHTASHPESLYEAEGGSASLTSELDSMGMMTADLLGGVVVQGLEALISAGVVGGLGDVGVDKKGNITVGGVGLDVQTLVDAIGGSGALGALGYAQSQGFALSNLGLKSGGAFGGMGMGAMGMGMGLGMGGMGGVAGGRGMGRRGVLGIHEAEQAMLAARKDHEALEKKLAGLMKKNRKMVPGVGK